MLCKMPGHVLRSCLQETWARANPGWLQVDDGVSVDSLGYVVAVQVAFSTPTLTLTTVSRLTA